MEMDFKKPDELDNPLDEREDRIYDQAIAKMREKVAQGGTYDEACAFLADTPPDLRRVIADDFLKIVIAEEHFGARRGLDDIALFLGLEYDRVIKARDEMLNEVGEEMARQFRENMSRMTH